MIKRRWLWFGLMILFLINGLFLLPLVRWQLVGWVKGEAFYMGQPTSYWAAELQQWGDPYYSDFGTSGTVWSSDHPFWTRHLSWWEEEFHWLVCYRISPRPLCP